MAGLYDEWKAREPVRDEAWTPTKPEPRPVCKDCGAQIRVNAHSHITTEGTARTVCEACYRWRAGLWLVFDPRSRAELERAVRAEQLAAGKGTGR
jgi:hypothetical protein